MVWQRENGGLYCRISINELKPYYRFKKLRTITFDLQIVSILKASHFDVLEGHLLS